MNGERVRGAFREGRTALVPYLTGGYPTLEGAREVGEAYLEAGADVLEFGVPFSDPLADGPTIQDTTTRALANGADLDYCLELASPFSGRVPVIFLLYYNVIFARGVERFLQEAAGAGVSGLVIPDLPVDEASQFAELAAAAGVAFCPLVAPTSTDGCCRVATARSTPWWIASIPGRSGLSATPIATVRSTRTVRRNVTRSTAARRTSGFSVVSGCSASGPPRSPGR